MQPVVFRRSSDVRMKSTFALVLVSVAISVASVIKDSRVVGGTQAAKGEFPYVVSLKLNNQFFCGGVIYNADHVMTTASCLYNKVATEITVVAGERSLSTSEAEEQRIRGAEIVRHEDFNVFSSNSDIGFIKLASGFTFNRYVSYAPVAASIPEAETMATLVGWGYTQQGGQVSDILLKNTNIRIRGSSDCTYNSNFDEVNMFCAGGAGNDACTGDAGSPLVNSNGEVIGLVAYIKACSNEVYPTIYTKVPAFSEWIANNGGSQPQTTTTTTASTVTTSVSTTAAPTVTTSTGATTAVTIPSESTTSVPVESTSETPTETTNTDPTSSSISSTESSTTSTTVSAGFDYDSGMY